MSNSPLRNLPGGWTSTTIGEVCQIVAGVGFPEHLQRVTDAEIPVFKVGDISRAWQDGQISLNESQNTVTASVARSLASRLVPASTVVFAKIGAAIALNRRAITGRPCLVDNNVMGLVPKDGLDSRFLFYFLCTLSLQEYARATTVPSIRKGDVAAIPLALPPTAEQYRLVDAIESYLTQLDGAIASLERVQTQLKAYRASVLKAAVEGRLVPTEASLARAEKRDYEPAEVLLARILKERRGRWEEAELAKLKAAGKTPKDGKWKAKYEEPVTPHTSTLPHLPEGWCWASVDQLGDVVTGTTPPTSNARLYGGDVPFFKPTDLDAGENVITARQYLSRAGLDHARLLPAGTVLVTCIGATIGKTGLARVECTTNQQINAWVSEEPVRRTRYGFWYFVTPAGHSQVVGNASSTTLPILNKSRFLRIHVPLPPEREQARIVAEIERHTSVADKSLSDAVLQLRRIQRLRQAVLKWAFEGKLVDQDSNDEPADRLLARIRAERAAVSPIRKTFGRRARGAA